MLSASGTIASAAEERSTSALDERATVKGEEPRRAQQHIGFLGDVMRLGRVHRAQVDYQQPGVSLAGYECDTVRPGGISYPVISRTPRIRVALRVPAAE